MMKITAPIRQNIREEMEKVARKELRYSKIDNIFIGIAYVGEEKTECVEITIAHKISMRFRIQGNDIIAVDGDRILYGSWDDMDFKEMEEYIMEYLSPIQD